MKLWSISTTVRNPYRLKDFLTTLKELDGKVDEFEDWKTEHEVEYLELKRIVDNLNNGTLTPALEQSIRTWLNRNAKSIIESWVKMVFFGLTDAGYFVAYIPDGWQDITFKTTEYDYFTELMPDYGHLVLQY